MSREDIPEDRRAPEGTIWVCAACGKTAEDQFGMVGKHSYGWDESCMLNAVLCKEGGPPWEAVKQEE